MTDPTLTARVAAVLRDHAAPALGLDPDALAVVAVDDGIASVRLGAACASCPATLPALLAELERVVRDHVPEVDLLEAVP